jgi:two-component system, sensor histidine kinase PdtaS
VSSKRFFRAPVLIAGIYFLFGFLWILLSDSLLGILFPDIALYMKFQTLKGWIYVVITTFLIYALVRSYAGYKERLVVSLAEREREAKERLAEKELLIREVHHRVKNNMQLIQSMIRLNLKKTNADAPELIEELNRRIFSMALIHEQMYKTESLGCFTLEEYLNELINNIRGGSSFDGIKLNADIEPIPLEQDAAIPCGIIINEVLTNAFKYAFPDNKPGTIWVRFSIKENKKHLEIQDDGVGFNPKKNRISFGLQLVEILAQQLNGEVRIESGPEGTCFSLVFP